MKKNLYEKLQIKTICIILCFMGFVFVELNYYRRLGHISLVICKELMLHIIIYSIILWIVFILKEYFNKNDYNNK
ncbi:hypothetical protein [Vallitalea guaymasensis]|uniref:hypothetical protein n=1 Tax=Vallitalea guaymasensis TaxID=1185412 RepID=UPI00235373BE|nr:hypothetical protein [Vallitalea guaymasensis]